MHPHICRDQILEDPSFCRVLACDNETIMLGLCLVVGKCAIDGYIVRIKGMYRDVAFQSHI
jgi:hypothetical protein